MLLFLSLSAERFDRLSSLTYTKYLYQINLCAQSIKKSEVYGVKVNSAIGRKVNQFCLVFSSKNKDSKSVLSICLNQKVRSVPRMSLDASGIMVDRIKYTLCYTYQAYMIGHRTCKL